MNMVASVLIAVFMDRVLGEPRRWHPLVGFGHIAAAVEQKCNRDSVSAGWRYVTGILSWLLLVLPVPLLLWWLQTVVSDNAAMVIAVVCLWFALGGNSLVQHARAVKTALQQQDMTLARQRVGMMVSRDTKKSDEAAISRATIESVLENGNDAIFAALFWFVLLGAPGVILFRFANTLDAMWGYKTVRFKAFGWMAARMDDGLNYIPARLTALGYALSGKTRLAWQCWQTQAVNWQGTNPGVVMAAGAGALAIQLGGGDYYHGSWRERPLLGTGKIAGANDIERAIQLLHKTLLVWLATIWLLALIKDGMA